jgi:hypothetical protein
MIFCSTTRSAGSNALPSSADHAASPAGDRALFTDAPAKRVAIIAATKGGVANPPHVRRNR